MKELTNSTVEVTNDNTSQIGEGSKMPCNLDAEKAVLGSFLNNNENLNKVADFLKPDHFYVPLHAKIYESILKFYERGLIASPVTLKNYFGEDDSLSELGVSSLEYLMKLSTNAASIINLLPYAKDIYETSLRRELIKIGEDVVVGAHQYNTDQNAMDLIEGAEQQLFNLASDGNAESGFSTLKASVVESIKRIDMARKQGGEVSGVTTGFIDLDKLLGGMQSSDLLILAARPSMGKTAFAINIAINAALNFLNKKEVKDKKSVAVFSLEMSSEQIANRILAIKTGIDGSRIRIGNISKQEFSVLLKESDKLAEMPIFIDDTPSISISALRTRARRLKRQHNLGAIVVDYLQLIRGSSKMSETNRLQEIAEISQGLKAIAKELDIPVLALSQLSRAVESRDDKRPQLSDLRESGNIEQDADVVMFIYREEYYLSRKMPQTHEADKYAQWQADMENAKGITEILIAKQRNGPIGTVCVRYDTRTTGFTNLDMVGH
ncbi:MAG: replicative DNA helicase [Candidatus Jidaibacter sp.]|jgi:replicative DNA helicase|nr:replicative DNA helicase [Candidatus Jidaibacter sp.]